MATKQLTDLTSTTTFEDGDLLLIRKTVAGTDNKIAQADFIKSFGNPAINGFTAMSEAANKLTLTASNDVVVDTYYDGMVAHFISDIVSTGLVQIKVGGLPYKDFLQFGTVDTVVLANNKYLEAIYVGDNATGKWFQTNLDTPIIPTIFTNEYVAIGVIAPDELSTTYSLTSAIGSPKPNYYNAMSALFTANIASKGAVLLNIDGIGIKNLTDPVGDNIPFDLFANEPVMAIYNGTNFVKHLFSSVDPEKPPIDPDLPVPDDNLITVNVGPNLAITEISSAIEQLIKSYGEDGGNRLATIQLASDYVQNLALRIYSNTPWITIKSAIGGNTFNVSVELYTGSISFTGIFNVNVPRFMVKHTLPNVPSKGVAIVKDSTINCITSSSDAKYCVYVNVDNGTDINPPITFDNVNVNGFNSLYYASGNFGTKSRSNFSYITGSVNLINIATVFTIHTVGNIQLKDINFGNLVLGSIGFYIAYDFTFENVTATTAAQFYPILRYMGGSQGSLINCNIRNTTTSTIPVINTQGAIAFNGGDFRHPNSSVNPDILIENYVGANCTRTNGTLASFDVKPPNGTLTDI
jgi:hypothetical protein